MNGESGINVSGIIENMQKTFAAAQETQAQQALRESTAQIIENINQIQPPPAEGGTTQDTTVTDAQYSALMAETKAQQQQEVRGIIGPENFNNLMNSGEQIMSALLQRAATIQQGGGDVRAFIQMMQDFSNNLYANINSANVNPLRAERVIKGATAAMSLKQTPEDEKAVKDMMQDLTQFS